MDMLTIDNVTKEYPTPADPLVVLRGVSLSLATGESLAILGPSGSGKSTLLAILGTLDRPTSGTVTLSNVDPFKLDPTALAHFRRDRIGFVFQDHHLLPQLSVLENVLTPLVADGKPAQSDVERARNLIERVGLAQRATHRPSELSGGERQRVAIARALIRSPALLLADEPTGNLDATTADTIGRLLVELQQEHNSLLVVVTHSQALADTLSQQKRIEDGRLP